MHINRTFFSRAAILFILWLTMPVNFAATNELLDQAQTLTADGNYRDALTPLVALLDDNALAGDKIAAAVQLLAANYLRLRQFDEAAAALEKIAEKHRQNWRYLFAVAQQYPRLPTAGTWFDNEFRRNRGARGEPRSAAARDRARVLQLCAAARELLENDPATGAEKTAFYLYYADRYLSPQASQTQAPQAQAWKLQLLTDLTDLPDYQTFDETADFSATGAPVAADGSPLLYAVPPSFAAAKNDGERWRSILAQLEKIDDAAATAAALRLLTFSQSQFGLDTLRYFLRDGENADKFFDGVLALDQLSDNEYVARLASGISRFALPDDYAPQKLRRKIFASGDAKQRAAMAKQLAEEYRERRQYENAVEWYEKLRPFDAPEAERALAAITGKWAKFEPADGSPRLVFRNADKITFVLYRLQVEELLADTLDYLRRTPQPDYGKSNVNDIGRRLVYDGENAYLGEKVATWEMDLTPFAPRKKFADATATVNLPAALPAGGYLLVGKFPDGNAVPSNAVPSNAVTSNIVASNATASSATASNTIASNAVTSKARIVVWRDNTALVQKTLAGGVLHYIADANTGAPLAGMKLTAWGYARVWRDRNLERRFVEKTLTKTTGADGCAVFTNAEIAGPNGDNYQWLVTATGDGRHAFYGFSGMWTNAYEPDNYAAPRTFFITDRPVYRPNDAAQIKLWTRTASYAPTAQTAQADPIDNSAGQKCAVKIIAPNGEVASEKEVTADRFGGAGLTWQIPASAPLGRWTIATDYGTGSFRVEEYRKPEFEVAVAAPTAPAALGDKITATVKAKYYFGEPVKNATVKYRVIRDTYRADWYPPHPWDWLYGNGFGWLGEDCAWLPGWRDWGCVRPPFVWWGEARRATPPELIAEAVAPLNENGELSIVIDTATAKLLHPDLDHRYRLTVEVTDASRRTIDGSGAVLVAKKPFAITAWSDRGFYELSATPVPVKLNFHAQTLDRQPVRGDGALKISRLSYQNGVTETVVKEIALKPDGGEAHFEFIPQEAGQYRAAYTLTTPEKIAQTGAAVFTVRGDSSRSAASLDARFNPLEIVPEKAAYAVGEKCRLQINANQNDATVLLFLRGVDGVNLPPVLLRLKDRSAVYEFPLLASDQPNIFVEALTVSGGKVFNAVRSLAVPPQKKILNVALKPAASQLAPAAASQLTVRLTDLDGKPYRGQAALTIYDKSVEYISGGSNVPDIRDYFWSWTRSHHGGFATSLNKPTYNLLKKGETPMTALSRFEETARDLGGASNGVAPRVMMMKAARARGDDNLVMAESAPLAAAPAMMDASGGDADLAADAAAISDEDLSNVAVRQNFADTAVWRGEILTDNNGEATIDFVIPETLTTWQVRVWAMGDGTAVGQGETTITTFKNLLVRWQTPRFLIAGDETTLSANIHNYAAETSVKTQIALAGQGLQLAPNERAATESALPADGETRADWRVIATGEGESEITVRTLAADGSNDAMLTRLPILPAGIDKTVSFSGALRPSAETAALDFDVPADRRLNTTRLEFRYSPSLALAVIDALPYLAEYPYGCTEQTLNRFAPLVIAQTALKKLGVNLAAIKDKQTNLNAQELGNGRAAQWAERESFNPLTGEKIPFAPVFDEKLVGEMVEYGIKRLTAMQNADGGWGWFSGAGEQSFPHTTAVVLRGLIAARNGGALIPGNIIARGADWLRRYQAAQAAALSAYEKWQKDGADKNTRPGKPLADNLDALIFMTLAADAAGEDAPPPSPLLSYLIRDRAQLSPYGKALFGLGLYYAANDAAPDSATRADLNAELSAVMKNLSQFVVVDDENQTAHLDLGGENAWWCWYGSSIETMAAYLQLLALTDAQNPLAPRLAKYLLNNRKHATRWNSTRDTALAVEALTTYLQTSGEMAPEMTVEIALDGKILKTATVNRDNLFTFDNTLTLTDRDLPTGKHQLTVKRRGAGAVYFNAYLSYFDTADHIGAAGLEIKAARKIYRLTPPTGAATVADARGNVATQNTTRYDRVELRDGEAIKSGDLLEIELLLEAKNDYEYLIFTDHKLAGTEPVSSTSGYAGVARGQFGGGRFGNRGAANDDASFSSLPAYVEYRDATVNFFLRELPRGANTARYRVRAVYPGVYHALPTTGEAMYAPELRCNGESIKVKIGE